jgi:parallel beta-helix repeat protein
MRLKAVPGIMLTLLSIGMLTLAFNIQPVKSEPRTWTVDDDGSADFHAIQEAINAASPRDTILVKAGTYYEHVVVDKTLSLVGQDMLNTVIDGEGAGSVVCITSHRTNISGFTVQKSGSEGASGGMYVSAGIYLDNASYCNITRNSVTENRYGIWLDHSSNHNTISENIITENNDFGVWLRRSSGNSISGNEITANSHSGILLLYSSNNVLRNNEMTNNLYNFQVDGREFSHFLNDVDASNTVDGKPIYYWLNKQDRSIPLNAGYVALVNCTNITIQNLNLTHNGSGALLAYTLNSTITQNNIQDSVYGIWLYESFSSSIFGNNITKNTVGIAIQNSSNNSIYGNNIGNNFACIWLHKSSNTSVSGNSITADLPLLHFFGVMIEESSGNSISDNTIENFGFDGIHLDQSSGNSISTNKIKANGEAGISLDHSSNHNTVCRNNITANSDYGIDIRDSFINSFSDNSIADNKVGIKLVNSSDNSIFHNRFFHNKIQACHENKHYPTYPSINTWDDGCEGNYWSDYNGTDLDGNGVGDTPYIIDENNRDNYPLMSGFSIHADLSKDGKVDMLDIAIVAQAFGTTPEDLGWNPIADLNGNGIIEILDIATVAREYGRLL